MPEGGLSRKFGQCHDLKSGLLGFFSEGENAFNDSIPGGYLDLAR